MITFCI